MQFRRRHCCMRAGALLFLTTCALLVVLIQQGFIAVRRNPSRTNQKDARSPSWTRSLANSSFRFGLDGFPQVAFRNPLGLNGSLSEEINSEEILKVEPYRYVINEPDKCRGKSLFLVLLITSAPYNQLARNAIRQTWGNQSIAGELGIVRLFLMGIKAGGLDNLLQGYINEESEKYHDILQQEYTDSYFNLTIKTLMGLHWVSTYCPNTSYIMKTDSDMFVNTEYLINHLLKPKDPPRSKYFTGYLMRGYKPNRNKASKWYMSQELYASDTYPNFCSGTGYVLSGDMAQRIYNVSLSIRRLHLEDVYIGICLAKLRIEPEPPENEFLFNHWKVSYSSCKYSQLITSHQFRPDEIIRYWTDLQMKKHSPCGNIYRRQA